MPEGSAEGIIKGMYLFKDAGKPKKGEHGVQLMGSGTTLREVIAAAELLDKDFGGPADIGSCPSFNELAGQGQAAIGHTDCHPEPQPPHKAKTTGPPEGRPG